ncbi:DUF6686 family protein [Flagellimonas sp. DF-77]|uniref:DUF6686 family protein n=1 Tax=Flagellimonas algarum TaxID=3230298 RepID=UPI00339242ED
MCNGQRVLNQNANGIFTYCDHSKLFQLVYNNLCFEFYEWELDVFRNYIDAIDVVKWESEMARSMHRRKIPIGVGNKHFLILMTREEVQELKNLLHLEVNTMPLLHSKDIAYRFTAN